jgi:hypothetical protein
MFPGIEQLVFIVKDMLLAGILLLGLWPHRSRWRRQVSPVLPPYAKMPLALYVFWVLIEGANFNLPNLLVPIWGIKAHLLYAGIIILVPISFRSSDQLLRQVVKLYPWLVIPVCCVALLQLSSLDTSFINRSISDIGAGTAYFGDDRLVRVTGTFSYISGMSSFTLSVGLLGVALFVLGVRSRAFLLGLCSILALLPATGSRSVVVVMAVGALLIFLAAVAARQIKFSQFVYAVIVGLVLFLLSLYLQGDAWSALHQRADMARGDHNRIFTVFTNAFHHAQSAGWLGFGAGSANYGSVALTKGIMPFSWLPMGARFEEESGRIMIELGMVGWFLSLAMRLAFLSWAIALIRGGLTKSIRSSAIIALPALALGFYQGNGVFAPPVGASYYWFCVAMLAMAQYENRQISLHRRSFPGHNFGSSISQ